VSADPANQKPSLFGPCVTKASQGIDDHYRKALFFSDWPELLKLPDKPSLLVFARDTLLSR
jgi:hypothetical protein